MRRSPVVGPLLASFLFVARGASAQVPEPAPDPSPTDPPSAPSAEPAQAPPPPHAIAPADRPVDLANEEAMAADLAGVLNQDVVNGASRTTETADAAPATATVVRGEDLSRYGIRNLGEALRFIALGTFTFGGQTIGNQTVGARGVAVDNDNGNHMLVVVDGSPSNSPLNGGARLGYDLGIPISMIDTIEVILGPGGVIYGGNAMLGVVNVRTKSAQRLRGLKLVGQMGISPAQGPSGKVSSFDPSGLGLSPRVEGTAGSTLSVFGREAEVTLGMQLSQIALPDAFIRAQSAPVGSPPGTPPFGDGPLHGVTLDSGAGLYGKVRVGHVSVDAGYVQGAYAQAGGTRGSTMAPEPPGWNHSRAHANAIYDFDLGTHFSGLAALRLQTTRVASHRVGEAGTCAAGGTPSSRCSFQNEFVGNGQSLELQGTWDFAADGRFQLMTGVEGKLRQVGNVPRSFDQATQSRFAPEGGFQEWGQTLGAYAQFRGRITPWLAVNAGLRGDVVHDAGRVVSLPSTNPVAYTDRDGTTNSALSPRAAVMMFPAENTSLYASYSRAFRAPSPSELYTIAPTVEAAGALSPETVDSGEVGLRQRFGTHRALVSLFVSRWNNLVGLGLGTPGKLRYQSVGSIDNAGANVGLEGSAAQEHVHYGVSLTYGYARRQDVRPPVESYPAAAQPAIAQAIGQSVEKLEVVGAPELFGNARVAYDFKNALPEIGVAAAVYGPRLTRFAYSNALVVPTPTGGTAVVPAFGYSWRSNMDPKMTDPMVEVRANIAGPIPGIPAVRYTFLASYLFSPGFEPTDYGPTPGGNVPTVAKVDGFANVPNANGQLFPAVKLTLAAGLEVTLDP